MNANPLPIPVIVAAERSADRLIRDLDAAVAGLTVDEHRRFVADCLSWARQAEVAPVAQRSVLVERALRSTAGWGADQAHEAAAWQLLLSALALADVCSSRRASG